MVVDTAYYDLLGLPLTATSLEIKRAYRKAAVKLHPDKNPNDPSAAARFQEVGEAYQVLSDDTLRQKYDKYGKQESIPQEGFEDPSEFFLMIFGGEAFKDWIGELSLLQELTKSAELSGYTEEEKATEVSPEEEGKAGATSRKSDSNGANKSGVNSNNAQFTSTSVSGGSSNNESKSTINNSSEGYSVSSTNNYSGATPSNGTLYLSHGDEADTLTPQQVEEKRRKEELEKFEEECRLKKIETRKQLVEKLVQRLSLLTETDMKDDVVESFRAKIQYEGESLKMESFGLEILHTIGSVYSTKARIFLKNQTFLGYGGFWLSMKEKGGVVKDTFKTVVSALDAQLTMQEYAKMQEDNEYHAKKEEEDKEDEEGDIEEPAKKASSVDTPSNNDPSDTGGITGKSESVPEGTASELEKKEPEKIPEKHTPEELADMERYLMGKVLAAAWSGSKFEIRGTLRGVCDEILNDKDVPMHKRISQAKAMKVIGEVFKGITRTEQEDEEARMFEELVAEASKKREKKKTQG